jgi:hypothetical protein
MAPLHVFFKKWNQGNQEIGLMTLPHFCLKVFTINCICGNLDLTRAYLVGLANLGAYPVKRFGRVLRLFRFLSLFSQAETVN